jgi:NAD(P)-dependent dehydrogenase (short-subunit alcohol dehydrogenase family)
MTLDNKTALVKETVDRLDRVDILVNNAVRLCALE